ncbi:MAG TPA: hypothetical protein PLU43_11775, partial [Lachnospiraceae bacterium]|nr:hypothetical protein [Lachnospiraceae bacterium]
FFQKNVLFGIDTRAQLLRIEGIFEGLQEGQFPVIIDPNYCNEYGQLGVLYPNLFLYIPALLRYFGISLEVSYRFFMILVNAMTVLIMFVSAKSLFHSSRWALASALFYCLEPYHLYVMLESGNGAGRGVAMAFLPMIFVGIYYIAIQNRKGWRWLAIGMWGIFSSHIIITFLAVGFLFVFCICNIKKFIHKAALLDLIKAIGLFGVLSAGTLLPFADFYFTDWNRQALEWSGFYGLQVHAGDIIRTPYSLLTLLFLFLAGVLFIVAYRKKLICESYYLKLYIAAVLLYFMTTAAMPWRLLGRFHIMNDLLNMIQVGHRFQTLISPIEAFLAGKLLQVFHHKKHTIYLYFLLGILLYCSLVCSYRIYFREGPLLPDAVTGNINSQFPEDYLPAGTKTEYYATN